MDRIQRARERLITQGAIQRWNLDTKGSWDVISEAGDGGMPALSQIYQGKTLGSFNGTYGQVIEKALTIDGFFTLGEGGKIVKVDREVVDL